MDLQYPCLSHTSDVHIVAVLTPRCQLACLAITRSQAMDSYKLALELEATNEEAKDGLRRTIQKINSSQGGEVDSDRAARAMADPEIQVRSDGRDEYWSSHADVIGVTSLTSCCFSLQVCRHLLHPFSAQLLFASNPAAGYLEGPDGEQRAGRHPARSFGLPPHHDQGAGHGGQDSAAHRGRRAQDRVISCRLHDAHDRAQAAQAYIPGEVPWTCTSISVHYFPCITISWTAHVHWQRRRARQLAIDSGDAPDCHGRVSTWFGSASEADVRPIS